MFLKWIVILLILLLQFPSLTHASLKTKDLMPEFLGDIEWTQAEPVTRKSLEDKVAMIFFCSSSSLACLKSLPVYDEWQAVYGPYGFTVVGLFAPKFEAEKNINVLLALLKKMRLTFAVGLDRNYDLWRSYNNQDEPGIYLIDSRGRIRFQYWGQLPDKSMETNIVDLLREKDGSIEEAGELNYPQKNLDAAVTPKIDFGYQKLRAFGYESRIRPDEAQDFMIPAELRPHYFYLQGHWLFAREYLSLDQGAGHLKLTFHAGRVFLRADTSQTQKTMIKILLEGAPIPKEYQGDSISVVNSETYLALKQFGFYEILIFPESRSGMLEMNFDEPNIRLYAMEFDATERG